MLEGIFFMSFVSGEVNAPGERILITKGGEGGSKRNGYVGVKGQAQSVRLDLKLIADIGLVGYGKCNFR